MAEVAPATRWPAPGLGPLARAESVAERPHPNVVVMSLEQLRGESGVTLFG